MAHARRLGACGKGNRFKLGAAERFMRHLLLLAAAALVLAGCVQTCPPVQACPTVQATPTITLTPTAGAPAGISAPTANPAAVAACRAAGGRWAVPSVGPGRCVLSCPNAGKPCTDASQCGCGFCESEGLGTEPVPFLENATGNCSRTDDYGGCHALVKNGTRYPMLCSD